MAQIRFTNFAYSTLAAGLDAVATTLSVAAGTGARFPSISSGDYFYITLEDALLNREIVKVTARVTDTLTIVRAQDNTTARVWLAADAVALRTNAAALNDVFGWIPELEAQYQDYVDWVSPYIDAVQDFTFFNTGDLGLITDAVISNYIDLGAIA